MNKRKYNNIKKHLNDIDFRSKELRKLQWEKDFSYWLEDLKKHKDTLATKLQLPLLQYIISQLHDDPVAAVDDIVQVRNRYLNFSMYTDNDLHVLRLYSAVCWYIQ